MTALKGFLVLVFAFISFADSRNHFGFSSNLQKVANLQNNKKDLTNKSLFSELRLKRSSEHIITDCIFMTSEEGAFYHKATIADGTPCGIYIISEPDYKIEVKFNYLDVPCANGGLVAFVDGWELNGEFFPSLQDTRSNVGRIREFCDERKIKKAFVSSQNVALIQYRMPFTATQFSFTVRFVKNPTPCNVLLENFDEIYTLRNYDKRSNCSVSTLFPSAVKVEALNVGVRRSDMRSLEIETGILHKCQKQGFDDYAQIGGSTGLDNANLIPADSVCGLSSKPAKYEYYVACGTTTIRLVSGGDFDNSVTISFRQLTEKDFNQYSIISCLEK